LQPSGGGEDSTAGGQDPAALNALTAALSSTALAAEADQQQLGPDAAAYSAAAGTYALDPSSPHHQLVQISAGADLTPQVFAQQQQQQQQQQGQEFADSRMPQDMNAQALNSQRSRSTNGRLQEGAKVDMGAGLECIKSSGGGRRCHSSANPLKQTLFDFSAVEPEHAAVHFMKASDQEDFRWGAVCDDMPCVLHHFCLLCVVGWLLA
jgi:hypothetical protein